MKLELLAIGLTSISSALGRGIFLEAQPEATPSPTPSAGGVKIEAGANVEVHASATRRERETATSKLPRPSPTNFLRTDIRIDESLEARVVKSSFDGNNMIADSVVKDSSKNAQGNIGFRFKLDAGPPRFELRFSPLDMSKTTGDILRAKLAFLRLVEFNSTIGIKESRNSFVFNRGELLGPIWSDQKASLKTEVIAGATVRTVSSSLVFPPNHLRFPSMNITLTVHLSDGNAALDGFQLVPTGVKYSFKVANFPYKMRESKLALVNALFTKGDAMDLAAGSNTTVAMSSGAARFNWASTINADGVMKPVTVSDECKLARDSTNFVGESTLDNPEGDEPRLMCFVFPRAQILDWDPELAFDNPETKLSAEATSAGESNKLPGFFALLSALLMQLI